MMDEKLFDSLDESLKEKLRNCKDKKELRELFKAAGISDLSDEELEGVAGGIYSRPFPDVRDKCPGFFVQ